MTVEYAEKIAAERKCRSEFKVQCTSLCQELFSTLIAWEKKLFPVLDVRAVMLQYLKPDRSKETSGWEGAGPFGIQRCSYQITLWWHCKRCSQSRCVWMLGWGMGGGHCWAFFVMYVVFVVWSVSWGRSLTNSVCVESAWSQWLLTNSLVLKTLRDRLLVVHQLLSCTTSSRWRALLSLLIKPTSVASSANLMMWFHLWAATQSWVTSLNSRGLNTPPWGAPVSPILTAWGLPTRKFRIQLQRI